MAQSGRDEQIGGCLLLGTSGNRLFAASGLLLPHLGVRQESWQTRSIPGMAILPYSTLATRCHSDVAKVHGRQVVQPAMARSTATGLAINIAATLLIGKS